MQGEKPGGNYEDLAPHEEHQPLESGIHKTIGVQPDPQHVHTEPGEAGDDVPKHSQVHDTAISDQPAPASMENDRIPKDDEQSSVFLRVPAPKTSPGLIRPNPAKHS